MKAKTEIPDAMRRRSATDRSGSQDGFTLIETLAVLSILALLVSLGLGHFAGSVEHGRLQGLASELRSLDARARLLCRTEGAVELRAIRTASGQVGSGHPIVELVRVVDDEVLSTRVLPASASLRWEAWDGRIAVDAPLVRIPVDRFGASDDVVWTLTQGDRRERWIVLGSTGAAMRLEDRP